MLQTASLILFVHFLGDFVFQSSKMAINKAHSLKWLLIHIAVYTTVILVASIILFEVEVALTYTFLNGSLHLVTDFFTSKMNAKLYQREEKRLFYCGIGFDQFIHGVTLLLTYDYLVIRG